MAYQRDGSTLTVFGDPAAIERIRRLAKIAGIGCAVVAVWAAVWFGLMLFSGSEILGIDDPEGTFTIIGGVGLGIAVLIAVVAIVLLTRARKLSATQPPAVLVVGREGITAVGHEMVPYQEITEVVFDREQRPTQWAPTLGGTAGNEIGNKLVQMPDQMRVLELHRREGDPVWLNLALHVPDAEFAALTNDLEAVLGQIGIPVRADDGPSPTP
ncbi:hypothetical protein [Ornithinimicrobium faecis]|uniref:hypothetical protein n=1 Tax=Ornithinimicrobium faecis TaxID=2934158 RepID=UPI00211874DB|nr:hypothetical protein [Ornithinimicrobium sp. HY1745]